MVRVSITTDPLISSAMHAHPKARLSAVNDCGVDTFITVKTSRLAAQAEISFRNAFK